MALFNQFSYVFIGFAAAGGAALLLRLARRPWRQVLAVAAVVALVFAGVWFAVRPGFSDIDSVQAFEATLANGRPSLLEFFSNYCMGCVAVRPAVDALTERIQDRFNILRVDIHTPFGRVLRERYTFSYSPEFVLFDRQGQEIWRAHVPPTDEQLAQAEAKVP